MSAASVTQAAAVEVMDDAVRHVRPAKWRMFGSTSWVSTDDDGRFTVSIDRTETDRSARVEVRVYDTTAVDIEPSGAPALTMRLAVTPTGRLAAATVAALIAHLEGKLSDG